MLLLLQQPLVRAPAGAGPGAAQTHTANPEAHHSWGTGGGESSAASVGLGAPA